MSLTARKPRPADLRRLAASDPALAEALRRWGPFPGFPDAAVRRHSHFSYLVRAIVFQQLAGAAARTIWGRVVALTPGPRLARPEQLLALREERLRGAGLSRNKLLSLRDLAQRVHAGELKLSSIARREDEDIVEALCAVRGIGRWTAQMFLLFRLGRLDVMPATDLGVQEGVRVLDGLSVRPTPAVVEQRGEDWAPLRSVAAWTLWRVANSGGS